MPEQTKLAFAGIRAVVLDIEGTVAPITFVKEKLFPFALKALPDYLAAHWDSPDFAALRASFPADAQASPEALRRHVEDLTARDVKAAHLKNLQGVLWRFGYESGELVTPLYDDVAPVLEAWRAGPAPHPAPPRRLAIFSSGSVDAQKMFFGHVGGGGEGGAVQDLRGLFEPHWFDTVNAGPKFEAESFSTIVRSIGVGASETLFFSDHIKEVEAARRAGLHAVLVVRPGNPPQETGGREVPVHSLREVDLDG